MKFKLTVDNLLLPLLIIVVLVAVFKIGLSRGKSERKQEISTTAAATNNIKDVKITAKQFSFSPNPIRLKLNEKIRLRITSIDVTHGFSVPELGIDEIVNPGKETILEFTPAKKGSFALFCSVTCGTGHSGMRGKIIIE